MADADRGIEHALFTSFAEQTLASVRPPGPDAVRRTVARRQQFRTAVVAAVIAALVTGTGAALLNRHDSRNGTPISPPTAVASNVNPEPAVNTPSGTTGSAATPSVTGSPSPTASSRPPSSPAAPKSATQAPPSNYDFSISGPSSVTLRPANGRYEGTFTIVVKNKSKTPSMGINYVVVLPPGIDVDYQTSGFATCVGGSIGGGAFEWHCSGTTGALPVGGSVTNHVTLRAAYAPGNDQTIGGFSLRVDAYTGFGDVPDNTPGDNKVSPSLILSGS